MVGRCPRRLFLDITVASQSWLLLVASHTSPHAVACRRPGDPKPSGEDRGSADTPSLAPSASSTWMTKDVLSSGQASRCWKHWRVSSSPVLHVVVSVEVSPTTLAMRKVVTAAARVAGDCPSLLLAPTKCCTRPAPPASWGNGRPSHAPHGDEPGAPVGINKVGTKEARGT